MSSGYGDVRQHHYANSLLPYFSRNKDYLQGIFPGGMHLLDLESFDGRMTTEDFFLCFEPTEKCRLKILETTQNRAVSRSALLFYENAAAYHYRKAGMERSFSANFGNIFSSSGLMTDNRSHLWCPACSFLHNFETGDAVIPFHESPVPARQLLAINPINTGIEVNPDRIAIINHFVDRLPCHVFGRAQHFEVPPCSAWKKSYAGEIPFSPAPYRFIGKIGVFSNYRFVLVIENVFSDGYITEKLGEPLAALTVPIYFGPPHVERYFSNLFSNGAINGHEFEDLDTLISFISTMHEDEYNARLESIRRYRSEYFDVTKYFAIWEFVLSRLFGPEEIHLASPLHQRTLLLEEINGRPDRLARRSELIEHVESGIDGWKYDQAVREILFEPKVMRRFG